MLDPNPYSRPQRPMTTVKGVVLHWVANPNTTDWDNRNFFNNRKYGEDGYGSAHEIIDLDGSILEVIPKNEMAYHVGAESYMPDIQKKIGIYPNSYLYGIEFTHPDWTGKPTPTVYKVIVIRIVMLCLLWGLSSDDVYRHYDITGKGCPKYYVNYESQWIKLKNEVESILKFVRGE